MEKKSDVFDVPAQRFGAFQQKSPNTPEQIEQAYKEARAKLGDAGDRNLYCPYCGGLVWAPVPYTQAHFASCPHYTQMWGGGKR